MLQPSGCINRYLKLDTAPAVSEHRLTRSSGTSTLTTEQSTQETVTSTRTFTNAIQVFLVFNKLTKSNCEEHIDTAA